MRKSFQGFQELVASRFSERGYLDRPVDPDALKRILETCRLAQSAANRQPWRIHLIRTPDIQKKVYESYDREWFREAPLIAVFTGINGANWIRKSDGADYLLCDITFLADHFVLAAREEGLGSCIIAAFDPVKLRQALTLPEEEIPLLMSPLGYSREGVHRERSRKSLEEIVKFH